MPDPVPQHVVFIVGGAVAGSEAAFLLGQRGILCIVLEQNDRPYGKIEDGLPRWHVNLRRQEERKIDEKLTHPGVDFVPRTKLDRDLGLAEILGWGPSAVILATGAWRDRPLPVPGIDRFVGHGFSYQNPSRASKCRGACIVSRTTDPANWKVWKACSPSEMR